MNETKTPWRKNLDKRYISGEDLKNGVELGKGLRPEMVVTLAEYKDAPTFDQKSQGEVTKTAIYLVEYPSKKALYKPVILNVENGEFLSKEIGNGSLFLDDFDTTKPFVLYAKPDRRHGFVARFKKYIQPSSESDPTNAIAILNACKTLSELQAQYLALPTNERNHALVIAKKDELKAILK